MVSYLIFFLALVAYFFLHSFLASTWFKSKFIPPLRPQTFRLIYNTMAFSLSMALIALFAFTPDHTLFVSRWMSILGFSIILFSLVLFYFSFRGYSVGEFLGTRLDIKEQLSTTAMNAYVRHPLYFTTIVFFIGLLLWLPYYKTGLVVSCGLIYIIIGAKLEEKKLVQQFGQAYLDYQKQVPFLWPSFSKLLNQRILK